MKSGFASRVGVVAEGRGGERKVAADKVGPRFSPHPVSPLASGVTSDGVEGRGNGRGEEKAPPGQAIGGEGRLFPLSFQVRKRGPSLFSFGGNLLDLGASFVFKGVLFSPLFSSFCS